MMIESMRFKRILVMLSDGVLIVLALYLSYALRYGSVHLNGYMLQFVQTIPLVLAVRLSVFYVYGLYQGMWRFSGVRDLITLIKATTIGSILIVGILFLFGQISRYPRSSFIISWFIIIVLLGGSRLGYRLYRELKSPGAGAMKQAKNILIIGAGRAGEQILRELLGNYRLSYNPVGFVDDDRSKRHMTIHGYQVMGNTRDIRKIVKQWNVELILIALPAAPAKAKRRIMLTCKSTGVKVKTLPAVGELLEGKVKVSALRDFQIEDLLGREPVKLDTAAIGEYLRGKIVMITGAGGSIGSELCRQVAQFSPKRLVLFERSEFNLYQIQMNLMETFPELDTCAVIGDVMNATRVERTLSRFMPEVIFHAAAYKHVPLMELNPVEALRNNVMGTWVIAELAKNFGVGKFVMISTDKAVRPTNIMGATKRISELICESFNGTGKTQFVTVRFGNVLNSVGSVIPLFKRQIEKGGPLTVTHPEIYRYFMTIPEAVQLIMQAGAMGMGGEIFILDMGEPVRIVDLAKDMITLSGLVPDIDVKIEFTGLRPGEKLYEELLTDGEEIKSTLHDKIKVAGREEVERTLLAAKLDELFLKLNQDGFTQEIVAKVKEIVPEFQPENGGPRHVQSIRNTSYELSRNSQNAQKIPGKHSTADL